MMQSIVSWLGLLAGSVGICIAIALQFVVPRRVDWRHWAAFFCVGSYLMLTHTAPLVNQDIVSLTLSAAMLVFALVAEVSAFYWVVKNSPPKVDREEATGLRQ